MKYLHLRFMAPIQPVGKLEAEPWGGMSFGWKKENGELKLAVCLTSEMDNFNKKIAHRIIQGRIEKGHHYTWHEDSVLALSDSEITKQLAKQFGLPNGFLSDKQYYRYRNLPRNQRIINLD